jgi:diacylglycerol kinase family enzyme
LLIAGGGDGTLSLAARHLAYRDIALGVLPLGTTKYFARTLGISLNVAAAVGVLASGKVADTGFRSWRYQPAQLLRAVQQVKAACQLGQCI